MAEVAQQHHVLEKRRAHGGLDLGAPGETLLWHAQVNLAEAREALGRALKLRVVQKTAELRPAFACQVGPREHHPVDHLAKSQAAVRQVLAGMEQKNHAVCHGGEDRELVPLHGRSLSARKRV